MRAGGLDVPMALAIAAILLCGLLAVYSASRAVPGEPVFLKQLAWMVLGLGAMWLGSGLALRVVEDFAYLFLGVVSVLLILTVFLGGGPAGRWLIAGPVRIQPSEFAKLALMVTAARAFSELTARPRKFGVFLVFAGLSPAVLLVWLQPDLGTAAASVIILLLMTWWAGWGADWIFLLVSPIVAALSSTGLGWWLLFTLALVTILLRRKASFAAWLAILGGNTLIAAFTPLIWNLLRPYQQARLTTFLNPAADPHGAGWNVIQSEVAVGSGGMWGQGYLQGAQKGLAFLPARHTDFIFSVWAEETGFAGSIILLAAFGLLVYRLLRTARMSMSSFRSILAAGTACYFAVHLLVNVGMTLGIMPVTGLPLVMVSYGGSHMVVSMFLAGLGLNLARNRREL